MSNSLFVYIFFMSFVSIFPAGSLLSTVSDSVAYDVAILNAPSLDNLDISQNEIQILSENCMQEFEAFLEGVTNLTRCTVVNARPIHVCVNCEEEINATEKSYEELRSGSSICQQFYFESDQVGIIDLVYSQGKAVWTKCNCQNCYDHVNDTQEFFNVSRRLDACIDTANKSSTNRLNNTCIMCHDLYVELNDIYNKFVKQISTYEAVGVCMDIVDQMNITRHKWSHENCISFDSSVGYPNIVTAVLVGAMPIFFYMLSKNISIIEDVKLVRPKRKSYTSMPSE